LSWHSAGREAPAAADPANAAASAGQLAHGAAQNLGIQELEGGPSLLNGNQRLAGALPQPFQEARDVSQLQLARMTALVKLDEQRHPVRKGTDRLFGVSLTARGRAQHIQQARP
jgi:hypothetical protein